MAGSWVFVSGWAHEAESLSALRDALGEGELIGVHELTPPTGTAPHAQETHAGMLARRLGSGSYVVGWSLGGMVALETAVAYPDRVRGLVLIGTTPRFCTTRDWRFGYAPEQLRELGDALLTEPEAALRGFFSLVLGSTANETGLTRRVASAMSLGIDSLRAGIDYLATADLRSRVAGIGVPGVVLHGRRDAVVPWRAGKWLARETGFPLELVGEATHDLPISAKRVAAAITEQLPRG